MDQGISTFSAFFPGWPSFFMAQQSGGGASAQPTAQQTDPARFQRYSLKEKCTDREEQQKQDPAHRQTGKQAPSALSHRKQTASKATQDAPHDRELIPQPLPYRAAGDGYRATQ